MECHPEENNHSKHKYKCLNTCFCFFFRYFNFSLFLNTLCGSSFLFTFNMFESTTASIVNRHRNDERNTCNGKGCMIRILLAYSIVLLNKVHNCFCSTWCEQCTNIDCHIENRESRISLICILRVIIKITHHYLQVTFKESCS